ncbi:HSP20 family protein [Algoriphagus alkaliphilus]|uniref:HSP20 family protein n=1 Tax=Algoriphagus alkaliphilus TaxID=279824 RepID=A0A1G5X0M3_9BACT|nr:Hsp20/alpha crystallin family protein [Algoriphagus alkaliphilus]MBA4301885.1 Hsp20/alpha crystallin family protein [Cyclobacterium sp.]SDA63466.1 HSP20 family protein [Algoriphagus alkaliphilus]
MSSPTKRNGSFWPKMVQDFFGAENPFDFDEKFFFSGKSIEVPSANVIENDNSFKLELAVPGFEKKDFKVEIQDGMLIISGEKEHKSEEEKENYRKKEFSYSSIRRSFALPEHVKEDQIDAKYENGILNIVLPKKTLEASKAKKAIEVG